MLNSKIFKKIWFLFKIFFILSKEYLFYKINGNYEMFIKNLTYSLYSVNILCVKVFQAIALNNDLIDDKLNNKMLQFTDNAPWDFNDIDLYTLVKLSEKYNLRLNYGYETPINSGMISLVFKLYDINNNPMIVKMKRKNIEMRLNEAIDNLLFVIHLLKLIPLFDKYQISNVIDKNIDIIRHQTNFMEEIENTDKIRNNCKNLKYVKIPYVIKEATYDFPDCILMEYINGLKITQIKKTDYEQFAKQIMKFGFVTSIIHGITHGDLHAGNVLFINDYKDEKYPHKIGVIDFGIIYELDIKYKKVMFEVLTQIFEIEPKETAIKLLHSNIIDPPEILNKISRENYNKIVNFTTELIDETINNSKKANQLQIYKFISKLKDCLNTEELIKLGIKPSDNFVKTQLVLAMSHGITLTLCNNDFINLADKVINELFFPFMLFDK